MGWWGGVCVCEWVFVKGGKREEERRAEGQKGRLWRAAAMPVHMNQEASHPSVIETIGAIAKEGSVHSATKTVIFDA